VRAALPARSCHELGRRYAHRRQRCEVVAVDQVVRNARMVRQFFHFFVQDSGGLELFRKALVGEIDRRVERQSVEDRRLPVLRVVLVQLLHCLLIKRGAGLVVDSVGFLSSIRGKEKNTSKRPSAPDPTGAGSPGANDQAAEEGKVCCSEDNQRGSRLIPNRRYKLPQLRQRKWWGFFWNN